MFSKVRIKGESDRFFMECWDLYLEAFPVEERRGLDYFLECLNYSSFRLYAIVDGDRFIGFIAWWDLADVRYVEYLATSPAMRGEGYGKMILQNFMAESDKPILLEVEHPEDEIKRRRIGFYERLGFTLNAHDYAQPPYDISSDEYLSLMVMTYPNAIMAEELDRFKCEYFPIIHFRHKFL
ncbi:MAG: GNAT family N-acetyltransferase [Bacteroidales bacterium]